MLNVYWAVLFAVYELFCRDHFPKTDISITNHTLVKTFGKAKPSEIPRIDAKITYENIRNILVFFASGGFDCL